MKTHEAGALDRVTRAAREWGLWLAFVLAAAHSISVCHAFTHEPTERTTSRGDKQLAQAEPWRPLCRGGEQGRGRCCESDRPGLSGLNMTLSRASHVPRTAEPLPTEVAPLV